jgi:hypothetical protein
VSYGVYLRRDVIYTDLERFSKDISTQLNANVKVFEEDFIDEYVFGYEIQYNKQKYLVFMFYDKNEFDEYAIKKNEWTVARKNGNVHTGFKTLGDVFDFITGDKHEKLKLLR